MSSHLFHGANIMGYAHNVNILKYLVTSSTILIFRQHQFRRCRRVGVLLHVVKAEMRKKGELFPHLIVSSNTFI